MHDEPSELAPSAEQLARWLRALADVVEHDPALAARVAQPLPADAFIPEATLTDEAVPVVPVDTPITSEPELPVPAIAHQRQSTKYGTPTVAGRSGNLGAGVPDPFAVYKDGGEPALAQALATLRAGTLRAIIRAHSLDAPAKLTDKATDAKLRTFIIAAVIKSTQPPKAAKGSQPQRAKKIEKPQN